MTDIKSLDNFKKKKKVKIVVADLEVIIKVLNLSIRSLTMFSKYSNINEIISVLQNHKTLYEIHLKKYQKSIEE